MPHRNVSPQLIAGGNISPSTFVKVSTAADNTGLQAGANDRTIGIAQVGPKDPPGITGASAYAAVAGDTFEMIGLGDTGLLLAGSGGFTRGQLLKSDANGAGVPVGTGVQQNIGAIALESAAAGEYGKVAILILNSFNDYAGASALLTDITGLDNSLDIRGQDGNNAVGGSITIAAGAGNNNNTGGNVTILGGALDGTGAAGNISIGPSNTTDIVFGVNPRIPVATVAATVSGVIGNSNAVAPGLAHVTGANNSSSAVKLPASVAGKVCTVKNAVTTATLTVFPPVSSQINANGLNNAYNIPNGSMRTFYCFNSTLWETFPETIA